MKNKLLLGIIIAISLIVFVSAAIYTEPWNSNQRGGKHNLTGMDYITANNFVGDISGNIAWSNITEYPVACPAYSAITLLNDSVTCTSYQSMANLTVTGNISAENVHLPCYLSTHTNVSITAVAGVWLNITFDTHDDTENARITHIYNNSTNDTFTIVDTGIYRISYGISFLDSQASPDNILAIRLINNNAEIQGSVFEKDTTKQNAVGTLYRSTTASLTAADEIKLQFVSNSTTVSLQTPGTYGDHPTSANINFHRVD